MNNSGVPQAVLDWFGLVNKDPTLLNKLSPDLVRVLLIYSKDLFEKAPIKLFNGLRDVRKQSLRELG